LTIFDIAGVLKQCCKNSTFTYILTAIVQTTQKHPRINYQKLQYTGLINL